MAADKLVRFIGHLTHTKGRQWAGRPFRLRPWQEHGIVRPLFGTLRQDGLRQYRTAYISTARKDGKTELAAALALALLLVDGEPGAEIYSAAGDREQAGIVFRAAAWMIRKNPRLNDLCRVIDSQKRIVYYAKASFYHAISAEAYTKHGYNAHGIIFDELHTQPNRDLWDVLETSKGAREQPLTIAITTAGFDRNSICYEQYDYAKKVLAGVIEDPTYFAFIAEAAEDDDWTDREVWHKANPALGDFRSLEEMEALFRRAQEMPALQNTFRRLYLNQWTQTATRWIDLGLWNANANGPVAEPALAGRTCYGGLDLSSVDDMTAWVLVFPRPDDTDAADILCRFWVPEAQLENTHNRYRDQYQAWVREGFLQTTPGNAVDYGFIKKQVLADAERFRLVDLNIDKGFQSHAMGTDLAEEGLTVFGLSPSARHMGIPCRELERRLLGRKLAHGGNPVLRWMADNVTVKPDPDGNIKPDKANSQGKIDGIVALILALDRAMRHEERKPSVYETRGLIDLA